MDQVGKRDTELLVRAVLSPSLPNCSSISALPVRCTIHRVPEVGGGESHVLGQHSAAQSPVVACGADTSISSWRST